MPLGRTYMHNSRKLPLKGLLMYRSFMVLSMSLDNDHPTRGRENGEIA